MYVCRGVCMYMAIAEIVPEAANNITHKTPRSTCVVYLQISAINATVMVEVA